MKKKIVAVLAAIAAVFGFGFASNAAMAADYGVTGTVEGNVVTLSAPAGTFAPNETLSITVDTEVVSNVEFVASKTYTGKAHADGSATVKLTLTGKVAGAYNFTVKGEESGKTYNATVTLPAAGAAAGESKTPSTGASVAPFAVAVALLAAAGVAVAAVRKTNAR